MIYLLLLQLLAHSGENVGRGIWRIHLAKWQCAPAPCRPLHLCAMLPFHSKMKQLASFAYQTFSWLHSCLKFEHSYSLVYNTITNIPDPLLAWRCRWINYLNQQNWNNCQLCLIQFCYHLIRLDNTICRRLYQCSITNSSISMRIFLLHWSHMGVMKHPHHLDVAWCTQVCFLNSNPVCTSKENTSNHHCRHICLWRPYHSFSRMNPNPDDGRIIMKLLYQKVQLHLIDLFFVLQIR